MGFKDSVLVHKMRDLLLDMQNILSNTPVICRKLSIHAAMSNML